MGKHRTIEFKRIPKKCFIWENIEYVRQIISGEIKLIVSGEITKRTVSQIRDWYENEYSISNDFCYIIKYNNMNKGCLFVRIDNVKSRIIEYSLYIEGDLRLKDENEFKHAIDIIKNIVKKTTLYCAQYDGIEFNKIITKVIKSNNVYNYVLDRFSYKIEGILVKEIYTNGVLNDAIRYYITHNIINKKRRK